MGPNTFEDRGVSEMLGFVLLFSIVLISIVSVSVVGMDTMEDGRDTVTTENVRANFDRLADSVSEVHRTRATRRSVTVSTGEGQLETGSPVTITLWRTTGGSGRSVVAQSTYRPIVFSLGEDRLIYSGTAVIREGPNGASMIDRPDFRVSAERALVPLVSTNASGARSVSGRTEVRFVQRNESVIFGRNPPGVSRIPDWENHDVRLRISPSSVARANAWQSALNDSWDYCGVSESPPRVVCRLYPDDDARIMVHNVSVQYDLSG